MAQNDLENWDQARYTELNAYFRIKIRTLLESDPFLKEMVEQQKSISLPELIDRMTYRDQQRWSEFLVLDRIKLQVDIQNHLEGKGTPYNPQQGFSSDLTGDENIW
ncbi:hypothetical protein AAE02nite_50110 [Adhaeribacter aerolatus]|uniref:Uncharacterized protein n=1 Tax=Adhaeribacter aerolatus TaxID=670289 RepID=A0A512B6E4_9BACT|nr:hypothetical protein [Adhaeribacter aerolatus]GEO07347.1 hypothetical protein AAE02nite_50110 [Adhaeribacter aerolatus]